MKIKNIQILNYRLLQNFVIQLEDILSLAIGKNNCGKTSFLSLLERFLNTNDINRFSFDDLNIERLVEIKELINDPNKELEQNLGIYLKLYIEYSDQDNLANLSKIMLDLDPDIKTVILSFEYSLDHEYLTRLRNDFNDFQKKIDADLTKKFAEERTNPEEQTEIRIATHKRRDIIYYLKKHHASYFKLRRRALEPGNESNFIDLIKEKIDITSILNFKRIKAKRDVMNEDGSTRNSDKTLSKMSSKYYEKIVNSEQESEHVAELQNELSEADNKLNGVYKKLFANVINKVRKFGGIKEDDSKLLIISSLEERNLLSNNTTVMYEHIGDHCLPEDYNGLGYMNLIAMIFEIEVLLNDFKKTKIKDEIPADINLLFIEEPEAHTHPQLQYIFIKNIKDILEEASKGTDDGIPFNLQTIVTTHSSHITAESSFDDIKYFFRNGQNSVVVKNLRDLRLEYERHNPKDYQFLKQYLTLNRAELFFADKAVLIEGDTERLIIPTIMKKLDIEVVNPNCLPLLSQNVSIVEVGAYSHIFERFVDFLEIKTLIITDLDGCKMVKLTDASGVIKKNKAGEDREVLEACPISEATLTSNASLKFFFSKATIDGLKKLVLDEKRFLKKDNDGKGKKWIQEPAGNVCVVFQKEEKGYHARSFEDAFIHLNLDFIKSKKKEFLSLKNIDEFDETADAFVLATECISKKPLFVLDIIFHSNADYSNWEIPDYIKEGLLWLKN